MTEIVPEPDQEETEAEESPAAAEMQKIEEDVQSETAESEAERQIEADDQIEGQMSLEDILAGWEQQAEEPDVEEESAYGEPVEPELDEIFDEAEEFAFTADEAEELLEEDGGELPDEAEELFEEESEELRTRRKSCSKKTAKSCRTRRKNCLRKEVKPDRTSL